MTDKVETIYCEQDEAVKQIKKRYRKGVSYFVRSGAFLYTEVPDEEGKNGRGYESFSNVRVSQKDAIKYVTDNIGKVFAEKKVKIKVSDHKASYGGCIFVG